MVRPQRRACLPPRVVALPCAAGTAGPMYQETSVSVLVRTGVFTSQIRVNAFVVSASRVPQTDRADPSSEALLCPSGGLCIRGLSVWNAAHQLLSSKLLECLAMCAGNLAQRRNHLIG